MGRADHGMIEIVGRATFMKWYHRVPPTVWFLIMISTYGFLMFWLHGQIAEPLRNFAFGESAPSESIIYSSMFPYISVVALLLSILAGQAFTQANNRVLQVQGAINGMAGSMSTMMTLGRGMSRRVQREMAERIARYVETVLATRHLTFIEIAERESTLFESLIDTMSITASDQYKDEIDLVMLNAINEEMSRWAESRMMWQTATTSRLNPLRLVNLELFGILLLIGLLVFTTGTDGFEAFMFAATAAAIRMLLMLLYLIDSHGWTTRFSPVVRLNYELLASVLVRARRIIGAPIPTVEEIEDIFTESE
ncbi:MAG: hypothetical protein CMB77_00915 [Euryarchaeota archaeon]|nr:hypothetical protein [Euryarchaeota archaeon]